MADVSLTHEDNNFEDRDKGVFEQGDGSPTSSQVEDDSLPPLLRIQNYAQSENFNDRRMVWELLTELFKTAPADAMTTYLPQIMNTVVKLVDESDFVDRKEHLKHIPNVAAVAKECSSRIPALERVTPEYLLAVVVRNLGTKQDDVWRCARTALFSMVELELVTMRDLEVKVCPTVLALSRKNNYDYDSTLTTTALTLMSKLATLLGPEVTERVFLQRFAQLCRHEHVTIRRVCAFQFNNFCLVASQKAYETILLPCFKSLCADKEWTVRKACADVAISVSCACPPDIRITALAPIFVKLLKDSSRWVRMSAFQTLGPFISTFADPSNSISVYSNLGDQMAMNADENQFRVNTTVQRRQFEMLHDYVYKNMFNFNPLDDPSEDFEVRDTTDISIDIPMSEDDESTESSSVEVTDIDKKLEDVIIQKSFNVVSKAMFREVIADDVFADGEIIENSVHNKEDNEDIKEIVETVKNAVLSFRSDNNKSEEGSFDNNKSYMEEGFEQQDQNFNSNDVNFEIGLNDNGSKGDYEWNVQENNDKKDSSTERKDDGDLSQFNSYNYWYISPDMPVDLSIVEEKQNCAPQTDHLSNLFSSIGLDETVTISRDAKNNDVEGGLLDVIEDDCTVLTSSELENGLQKPCVPKMLVLHFMSMTDPTLQRNTDDEMAYHCAFSLPAVAVAIGRENWHFLQDTIEDLASDVQYKVRKTVASSLHILALILGPEITSNYLVPIFEGFIKDLDEVRIGVLKHLAEFMKLLTPSTRAVYLPRLTEFLQADNELNWRFRQELAEQLRLVLPLFRAADAVKHIVYIATTLLSDKVAVVRDSALELVSELLKHISVEKDFTHRFLIMLAERFAHSKKWKRRQTFTLLCCHVLSNDSVPLDVFATDVMPHLLDLSWDPVPNVRLVVARTIAKNMITNPFFSDPTNQYNEGLETVMRRLQADKDKDVRHSALIEII